MILRPLLLASILAVSFVTPAPADAAGTLDKIRSTKSINLGYRSGATPFSSTGADGEPVGYSIDLCREIAASIQKQLELDALDLQWIPVTSEDRFDAVAGGRIDIECGSSTNTLSRQEKVDFTLITFVTGGSVVVLRESGLNTPADFQGKTIAVVANTTTEGALKKYAWQKMITVNVVTVASHEEGLAMLDAGKVDAYAADQIVLRAQVLGTGDQTKYRIGEGLFSFEPYGLVIPRGDPDFRLACNRALARMFGTNKILAIYRKWFGQFSMEPEPILEALYRIQALPE